MPATGVFVSLWPLEFLLVCGSPAVDKFLQVFPVGERVKLTVHGYYFCVELGKSGTDRHMSENKENIPPHYMAARLHVYSKDENFLQWLLQYVVKSPEMDLTIIFFLQQGTYQENCPHRHLEVWGSCCHGCAVMVLRKNKCS